MGQGGRSQNATAGEEEREKEEIYATPLETGGRTDAARGGREGGQPAVK